MEEALLPLISIIVPIYNVEEYLKQCINSIISQTYSNIQIILIDDGSTDESGKICDLYSKQDNRIEVIHKKNGGLVSARKEGVAVAKGEYIYFVDSDDWIDTDALQRLIDIGQNADIITCACCEEYGDYQVVGRNSVKEGLYITDRDKREFYSTMLMNNNFFEFGILPHLCDKLIKRKILLANQMEVDDLISYGEDAVCTYPCLLDAESIYISNIPLYHYRQRTGSIVKSSKSVPDEAFQKIYSLLKAKFDLANLDKEVLLKQLHYYMWFILLVKSYGQLNSKMILFPFTKVVEKMRIVIYGAGGFGKAVKSYCDKLPNVSVVGWSDKHYDFYQQQGLDVVSIEQLQTLEFDCMIIAIMNEHTAEKIKNDFIQKGIQEDKIDWVKKSVLENAKLPDWIN